MNEILRHLARHGYSVLFASVFARQICLPVPAILFLLAGGALVYSPILIKAGLPCCAYQAAFCTLWYEGPGDFQVRDWAGRNCASACRNVRHRPAAFRVSRRRRSSAVGGPVCRTRLCLLQTTGPG